MRAAIAGAITLFLLLAFIIACGEDAPSPMPTQTAPTAVPMPTATPIQPASTATSIPSTPTSVPAPTATPIQPSPTAEPAAEVSETSKVTGTITYRERIALSPNAVVEVKLSDVSLQDAPSVTIEELTIRNPGQVPISFEIEYDPEEINERLTYAIQVRIMEGDDLAFINDTAYDVITRDNPHHVDMVLVRVGGGPSEPEPTSEAMVETPAPIESVEVVVSDSDPKEYSLRIVSGLPSGCAKFGGYEVDLEGTDIVVNVINLMPSGPVACITVYETHEFEINLGSDLTPDETYTVIVNGELTSSFLVRNDRIGSWILEQSPIENIEVVASESNPPAYSLNVHSVLPQGSSCSVFNGYDISRRGHGAIEVKVTHLRIAPGQLVPCTADLPSVITEIPIGSDFIPGEQYSVTVNEKAATFTAGTTTFEIGPCRMTRAAQLPIEFEYRGTIPTGFDGINTAGCTFTKPVETVTVVITGPADHTEVFTLTEPSTEVAFPLPEGTLSRTTREIVPPGTYKREITVTSVDGEILLISGQPGMLPTVTILDPGK